MTKQQYDTDTAARRAKFEKSGLSQAELARRADVHADTVRAVLSGKAGQVGKARKIDAALDEALGIQEPVDRSGLVEIEIAGADGATVVVRGPVADRDALEAAAVRLIARLNRED